MFAPPVSSLPPPTTLTQNLRAAFASRFKR